MTPDEEALRLLSGGEVALIGLLPHSSNYTFLAELRHPECTLLAVYKPREGETPLWDFPDGTLYQREVAAFELSRALGWPAVPPTVIRDGPHGTGSMQLFVEADPGEHFFTLRGARLPPSWSPPLHTACQSGEVGIVICGCSMPPSTWKTFPVTHEDADDVR